jgi:hypothetical protein
LLSMMSSSGESSSRPSTPGDIPSLVNSRVRKRL